MGRPETSQIRVGAMGMFGAGLFVAGHNEDALSVREAELSTLRRRGVSEETMLAVGENDELTLKMRTLYAQSLYHDNDATLDELREAVRVRTELVLFRTKVRGSVWGVIGVWYVPFGTVEGFR